MSESSHHQSAPIDRNRLIAETCVAALEHHARVGSTNDRAKLLARQGDIVDLPMLVSADQQTAGRGRGANRWWTGPGSLAFSLLVDGSDWDLPRQHLPLTALAAGISLAEAVSPRLSDSLVGLHWPNDLFVNQRKLAGILVELPTRNRLVVGVGVNTNCRLADAPDELRSHVTTLIDLTGQTQDHTELLIAWLVGWQHWTARLRDRAEEIGRRADQLCLQHGLSLRLRQGAQLHEGRCLGIAPDGGLRLETKQGIRVFYSGTLEK